ncbi:winged helix-turn-helix domain-containing protein [Streptomyces toxytricini]|uniref:Winged helix-turn-helix domain-containing protein n=1 Tax=Streptomyces toxytricini TaxID=67369 RepID=A0ABW8ENU1_STRT5
MSQTRSLTPATPAASAASAATAAAPAFPPPGTRHRLRAVSADEPVDVAGLLPPGATWLPAPQHALPVLPGRPPMVGYLVLVPADRQPVAFAPQSVPPAPAAAAPPPTRTAAPTGAPTTGDGRISIDAARRTAEVAGRVLDLTYLEFELLAHLVAHPHRVHTRDQLVTTVWGYGHVGDGRTVDVHVARLRRKLGAAHRGAIQTVRRVGYKYAP